ncbi:type I restriction enzyme HsdR N-terminal domain-containing protein [Nonlabens xiamenensis]|uniref:type I restriction enzyme HsdR N-terminal domain-containing protein n=1 Tax=Nonlabens xiamenensis TaxID=2341043 RepID=UPI000F60CF97|nr:type I restriction enzyme HsdR N-terminal domain-containing protein [Nonlabens xiamenensis]
MEPLQLPAGDFRVKNTEKGRAIFDPIRKKFVHLTPEEWVRQHVIWFLLSRKRMPQYLVNVEKQVLVSGTTKRYDILSYNKDGSIHLVVECKAPQVPINQEVFDQIARYNLALDATYLMVTNGLQHYYCTMDYESQSYNFIPELPVYQL